MKRVFLSLAGLGAGLLALTATPAAAQAAGGTPASVGAGATGFINSPSEIGILATTPSRIAASRREMNRDRPTPFEVRMSRRQTRRYASELLQRADINCSVGDALVVARTVENIPAVEVECVEGGGLVIIDTLPIQATDCLDFEPAVGEAARGRAFLSCRLPGNIASVAAERQSARN